MKRCSQCGEVKPLSDYYKGSNGQKFRTMCKPCHKRDTYARASRPENRERMRQRHASLSEQERRAHKQRVREYHRRAKYGLTNAEWERMYEAQGGLCGICGDREATHVDHAHDTGTVRMLLCNQCNQLLGFAREEPFLLRAAASYLETQ